MSLLKLLCLFTSQGTFVAELKAVLQQAIEDYSKTC